MNFSALNTHAIGVISASAGVATVEGAASLSAGASASAQATLHSHATASVINSVALTTTQSVVRFAMATATLGCNAAANVEGYRVKFSNAEIVCAASSDANAVVHRQAVVYVTAQATNVAVGSRVAYASASLQAECNLTANSGKVIFAQSTMESGYWTAPIYSWVNTYNVIWRNSGVYNLIGGLPTNNSDVAGRFSVSDSTWQAAWGYGGWFDRYITNQSDYQTGLPYHTAQGSGSSSVYAYYVQQRQITTQPQWVTTFHYPSAALSATATVHTVFYGTADIAAFATSSATASNTLNVSGDITASAVVTSSAYKSKSASANIAGSCSVIASTSGIVSAESDIAASSDVTASSYVIANASGSFTGSSLAISVGEKKAVAHTTLLATAAMSSSANAYRGVQASINATADSSSSTFIVNPATASVISSCSVLSESSAQASAQCSVAAQANLSSSAHCILQSSAGVSASSEVDSSTYVVWDASGVFTGSSLAISVGEKRAVAQTTLVASAALTAVATSASLSYATVSAQSNFTATSSIIHDLNASVTASSSLSRSDTQTFVVTASGGNYVIASQSNRPLDFKVGSTYTFDLSSSSNGSHPLRFSTTNNGTHGGGSEYTTGVTITGSQGQAGSSISIVVTEETPSTLYYYCAYHSGMGGTVSISSADDVSASINSFASAALNGSALITASSNSVIEASVTIASVSELTAAAHAVLDAGAAFDSTSNVTAEAIAISGAQASVSGSSALSSVGYNVSSASATFIGSSIAISVGHKKSVAHTTINASAAVSSAANSEVYNTASVAASAVVSSIAANYSSAQASCVAQSSVSSSAFNTANPNAAIIAHANTSATTATIHFATANIDGSCVIATAPSLIIDVSAALSAFAVSISVGNKISVGHAQYTGSANLTAVAQASSNGQATVTCSASVSSSAIAARIIQAEAHVLDSFDVTPGYWIPSYTTNQDFNAAFYWVHYLGSEVYFTYTPESIAPYYSNNTYTGTNIVSAIKSVLDSGAPAGTSYVSYLTSAQTRNGVSGFNGGLKRRVTTTHPAVWVAPVYTPTGYTPNAQVVVSDVSVLSGSFAYPTASAEVTATGTRLLVGIADVTSAASATSTSFKVRFIDASGVHFDATADLSLSVTVDILGSAQVLADAEATAESFKTVFASGAFSGSSLAISVGNKKAVGQTDIVANALLSATSYNEVPALASVSASAGIIAVGRSVIQTAALSEATATASIYASAYLSESVASASVNAGASGFADGDTLIGATARVSDEGYLTPAVFHPEVFHPAVIIAGYWVPAVWEWVVVGHTVFVNGSYSYGPVGSGYRFIYPGTTTYQNGNTFLTYAVEQYTETAPTYYVNPVTVSEAYTTPAYTVPAFYTYTGFAPRANTTAEAFIQFSFSLTASSELYATAGAIQTASAQISASADTTSASHIESAATCTLNGTGSISPVNTNFLVFTSAALSASSDVVSLADKEIYGKADVVGTADIAVSGTGINAAFGYSNAAASVVATAFRMRVPSPINAIATAELVSSFTYVSQTGERSNGILILVEAEVRSIAVEAIDRRIIVDAEDRTIFAEAA